MENVEKENTQLKSVENENLPESKEIFSLTSSTNDIINKIDEEQDIDKLKNLTKLFNLNLVKKNMVRIAKESDLLDAIIEQASERFNKRPDEISNKELLDYLTAVQTSIEKSSNTLNSLDDSPMIQINQNEVNVNVGTKSLDRDSRERILDVVKLILNQSDNKSIKELSDEVKIVDKK